MDFSVWMNWTEVEVEFELKKNPSKIIITVIQSHIIVISLQKKRANTFLTKSLFNYIL